MFHESRSLSKSALAISISATCCAGLDGGQAARNPLSLLQSSVLYIEAVMLGKSMELEKEKQRKVVVD